MLTSLPPSHSPPGKPINTSFYVLKELHPGADLASPSRRQKWDIAHAAQSSPTLPCHHPMTPATMWKQSARAPPCGSNWDLGHHATLQHTITTTFMAPFPPIGIGRRPHWTLKLPPRYRCPACMTNPWIPQRLQPPCMRNPHLLRPLCVRNRPPARKIRRGPLFLCQRHVLCPHRVIAPRLACNPPYK